MAYFLKNLLIYFHTYVYDYVSLYVACACRGLKSLLDLSELELEEGVSHHMGSGDRTWVLYKISKYP